MSIVCAAQTFRGSLVGGFNLSQVDGDDLRGFHQPGINAGLRVVALLSDKWRVGPELLFSQQGALRNQNAEPVGNLQSLRFQTLELPLIIYYKDWRLIAAAGASYQRLISYRIEDTSGEDISDTVPLSENWIALQLGLTLQLSPKIGFDFRWSRHFNDLQTVASPRLRGRTLTLRLAYTIDKGETIPGQPTID
jgi:hypothetical protein